MGMVCADLYPVEVVRTMSMVCKRDLYPVEGARRSLSCREV